MRIDQQITTASATSDELQLNSDPKTLASQPAQIDAEALQEIRRIDAINPAGFLIEMIDCYFDEVGKLLQSIHYAIAQADSGTLKRAAHTLRSTSAMLGATILATLSRELEVMADTESLINASQQAAKIEAEYQRVTVALQIERQRALSEIA